MAVLDPGRHRRLDRHDYRDGSVNRHLAVSANPSGVKVESGSQEKVIANP